MERIAFRMKLYDGFADEYKNRHAEIWPELRELLKASGVADYSIFIEEDTNMLVGVFKATDTDALNRFPESEVMQRWWKHMSNIMLSNPDGSPVIWPLKEVFYLP